jgi:hypothetical protein
MPDIQTVLRSVITLLTEAYAGPPDPRATWFIDNEPDSGILGLLKRVSAEEASRSVDGSGAPGTTIASHVEHLHWSLANANAAFRGQPYNPNWSESWRLHSADQAAWDALRDSLRAEFEAAREIILQQQDELPEEYLLGAMALVPHAAFHLGVLRQMVERVGG